MAVSSFNNFACVMCAISAFVFDLPWFYGSSKGYQSSQTFLAVNLKCKVEVVVLPLMVKS